jgi:transposase
MEQTRETGNDSPPTKIPKKPTKKAIAKKEILRLLRDGKFYSTKGVAAKIPSLVANQRMILRYLKELEMTKEVRRTFFLWSIN